MVKKPFIDKRTARTFRVLPNEAGKDNLYREITPEDIEVDVETLDDFKVFNTVETQKSVDTIGEAAKYGVYYDDSEYDYMQHLKPVGVVPGAVLITAATESKVDVDAQRRLDQLVYSGISKLNLDPDVRQALDALEDDAYVDEFEDDFINHLNEEGSESEEIVLEDDYVQVNRLTDPLAESFDQMMEDYDYSSESDTGMDIGDFSGVLEDLDGKEIVGKKLEEQFENESLEFYRNMLSDEKNLDILRKYEEEESEEEIETNRPIVKEKPQFDCQSVLSISSKYENRPNILKLSRSKKLDCIAESSERMMESSERMSESSDSMTENEKKENTVPFVRSKDESREEKRMRKTAVKLQKKERRKEKKETKELYNHSRQVKNQMTSKHRIVVDP